MPVGHVLEHILQFDSCQDSANGNADQLSVLVMHKSVLAKGQQCVSQAVEDPRAAF